MITKLKDIIPKIYLSGKIHRWLSKVVKEINIQQNLLIENKISLLKNNLTADKLKLNNLYEKEFDDIKTSEDKKNFYKEKEKALIESIETSKKSAIATNLESVGSFILFSQVLIIDLLTFNCFDNST